MKAIPGAVLLRELFVLEYFAKRNFEISNIIFLSTTNFSRLLWIFDTSYKVNIMSLELTIFGLNRLHFTRTFLDQNACHLLTN